MDTPKVKPARQVEEPGYEVDEYRTRTRIERQCNKDMVKDDLVVYRMESSTVVVMTNQESSCTTQNNRRVLCSP